jgi:GLPGLI family protein
MKKIIAVCLISLSSFGQVVNGKITYTVKVGTDALFENMNSAMQNEFINDKESENYYLLFDKRSSVFKFDGGLTLSNNTKSEILYYKDIDSTFTLRPQNDPDFGKIIIKENREVKWILTGETKLIDSYKCFKATSSYIKDLGNDKKTTFPIIAWYCPEIPISFGPLGYGGLPGLILELQERIITYGAKTINFNLKNFKSAEKPLDGKRISLEELNLKIRQLYYKQ